MATKKKPVEVPVETESRKFQWQGEVLTAEFGVVDVDGKAVAAVTVGPTTYRKDVIEKSLPELFAAIYG
jgi:hypothetical protein